MSESPHRSQVQVVTRAAIRSHVSSVAVGLFVTHGFDAVTIDQIVAAAGISRRTFHRYFAAKEDVVVGDGRSLGILVRDALEARPVEEPVWTSLRFSFEAMLAEVGGDPLRDRQTIGIIASTPALRARNLEKHLLWAELLVPIVVARLSGEDCGRRAEVLVHSALACLDVSLATWAMGDSADVREVLERTFGVLMEAPSP